jgi:hypothetical protein
MPVVDVFPQSVLKQGFSPQFAKKPVPQSTLEDACVV